MHTCTEVVCVKFQAFLKTLNAFRALIQSILTLPCEEKRISYFFFAHFKLLNLDVLHSCYVAKSFLVLLVGKLDFCIQFEVLDIFWLLLQKF